MMSSRDNRDYRTGKRHPGWRPGKKNPPRLAAERNPERHAASGRPGRPPPRSFLGRAFAVGRTQQLVYVLNQLTAEGRIPRVPIFVDSPLSVNATEVFRLHPECFDDTTYAYLQEKGNPFGMENLTYIREVNQSKKLNDLKDPAVIISASGMAEAGRVRHHLANHIGNPRNLVLFVGYCAEHTLGAQIIAGRTPVNIHGVPYPVRAQVAKIDAFSGHADRNELSDYVRKITGNIRKITVVHGDESQSVPFADTLRGLRPGAEVIVPNLGDSVEF